MILDKRVGQRAFEAVADLDPHLVLLRRNQKQHAIVLFFLAKAPGAKQSIGVRLDLVAFERFHRGDDKLDAGLGFERGELFGELLGHGLGMTLA